MSYLWRKNFFENAGGALTLRSALETSTKFAAIPDNQGRDNFASHTLNNTIKNAKVTFVSYLMLNLVSFSWERAEQNYYLD